MTKKACWHSNYSINGPIEICDTYSVNNSSYYGGSCNNGTFNPYCTSGIAPSGKDVWKFYYPTCSQIDFPCLKADWGDGTCTGETTCTWAPQDCDTTDSCTVPEPKLRPGLCSPSSYDNIDPSKACQIGSTAYKACCNSDGTLDGNCTGGDYTGTCPTGKITLICGVTEADCAAAIPYPCTTTRCDSSNVCASQAPCSPADPDTPTLSSPSPGATNIPQSVNLIWNDLVNWGETCDTQRNNQFKVFLKEGTEGTNVTFTDSDVKTTVSSSTTSYSASNLKPSTTYSWKVQATNGARSKDSSVFTFTHTTF